MLALTAPYAQAQAQPSWSLGQIMQATLANHPLVLGKRSAQAAAKAEREGAEWQRYPTPSFEASTQGAGALRVDQPLWTGGRITANLRAADSRLDAAGAAIGEARQELMLRVITAASEAQRQQARRRHGITGVGEHEKLLGMIERRVAQEVSPLADQRLAASRLYASVNELSLTTQALNNVLAQLSQLTGQSVLAVAPQAVPATGMPASLELVLELALAHSPTLRRLAFDEDTAIADIAAKRSAYLPQVVLRFEKVMGGPNPDTRLAVVLLAQPGAGLSAGSGVDAAIARREAARLARETAERELRERVTLDWNEWQAAGQRLGNARLAQAVTAQVSESYARQYTAGRKTWVDVLNAVRETLLSDLAAEDAQAQTVAAGLRLQAQTGIFLDTNGALP